MIVRLIFSIILLILLSGCDTCKQSEKANGQNIIVSYDFESGDVEGWRPNIPENWRVVEMDGSMVYELIKPGKQGEIRAPTSWSVFKSPQINSFIFSGRFKSKAQVENLRRDLCIIFHYKDPQHFYYVHFSAVSDDVHNIIGLVNGADRIKINNEEPGKSAARLIDMQWRQFKVEHNMENGEIHAYIDDMSKPVMTAIDTTLKRGFIGVGSFDDAGYFDDLILRQ